MDSNPFPETAQAAEPGNSLSAFVFRILFDDEARLPAALPAAQARIWSAIDRLRQSEGRSARVAILERVSEGLHRLRTGKDPIELKAHFRGLAGEWLGCATLH